VAQTAQEAMAETHQGPRGAWSISGPTPGREAQKALPQMRAVRPTDLLGLGAPGTTANGVNLNLTPQLAVAAVGVDQLARERRLDGARRKSAHLGSWKSMGLERWRPALENYVASVQPGNQTALNAARVPFARYLNAIHNRLHPIFADRFLATLEGMPADHPMNRQDMVTHIEIVLSKEDGRIVRMGVTKSSGVTAFDVGALDSVQKASPYGTPPGAIVSPDGNVYLHWEFYRQPFYACSTYFAHPYMLKGTPASPAPSVAPPRQPSYDNREGSGASPGDRSGSLDQNEHKRQRGATEPGAPESGGRAAPRG
jgi:TonB family protein